MNTILFFASENRSSAPKELLLGIKSIAAKLNWVVMPANMPNSDKTLHALLEFWSPAGVIAECGESPSIGKLNFGRTPVVFIDPDPTVLPPGSFCVSHDSIGAGKSAARHLLMLNYPNYAFVPNPSSAPCRWSKDRLTGFAEGLELNGRTCTAMKTDATSVDAPRFQSELRSFLRELPKPCAVFVANDRPAEAVVVQSKLLGLRIPDDIAVLGVDNNEAICDHSNPSLSSVKPDFLHGGEIAALMMAAVLRDKRRFRGERHRQYGSSSIVKRASTHQLLTMDGETQQALETIRANACNGLTAETVMKLYSCSRPLAAARFRRATGHTILEEIHSVQIERAKALLADPNIDLKVISDFCGIASASTLRKLFLRKTGVPLGAWRKHYLQERKHALRAKR